MRYCAAIWPGNGSERARWAVLGPTGCYTFPRAYGRKNAERLAARYNREILTLLESNIAIIGAKHGYTWQE